MPAAFAPLFGKSSSQRPGAATTRVEVVSVSAPTAVRVPLRSNSPSRTTNPIHSDEACKAPPKVIVQKQDDVVTSIRIECPCGQVIELACEL